MVERAAVGGDAGPGDAALPPRPRPRDGGRAARRRSCRAWRRAFADAACSPRLGVERFAALWAIEALFAVEAATEAGRGHRAR